MTKYNMEKHLIREKIIKTAREFFYKQDFHEVVTPILNSALPLEPHLRPFTTVYDNGKEKKELYLAMSPERGIKKILSQGMGNCFALSKSFRNYERVGSVHMREFLMLEWYRKSAVYTDIMNDAEKLVQLINQKMGNKVAMKEGAFPRLSLISLFKEKVGVDLAELITSDQLMRETAQKMGYTVAGGTTWEELYTQLFVNEIESRFSLKPFFLVDFPARISPLCKAQKDRPLFAERFELYVHKMELGNGNTENTDIELVRTTFEEESKKTGMPIDKEFLSSLEGMKNDSYAGIGLGVDRLVMLYTNSDIFV